MQKRNVLKKIGVITVFSAALAIALNMLLLYVNLAQYSERYQKAAEMLYSVSFAEQILYSGFMAPVLEEVLFRGFMFRLLRRWCSFPWAMVISAVAFGAYHGNLVQFVYASVCGLVFAYLYEKHRTIFAAIWSHIVMNLASILLTAAGFFEWIAKI